MMNIMFLMGGIRLDINKEKYPLYLTEINEKTILEQQVEYLQKIQLRQLFFCINEAEIKQFHTDFVIKQIVPSAMIIPMAAQTKGAICTALLGIAYIDTDRELLLLGIDDFMDVNGLSVVNEFRTAGADAGVISFNSIHPRYSFVKTDKDGLPVEFSEKTPISKNALASFYYFKKGVDFVECAKEVIRKGNVINGNFFISQTLNEMLLKQKKIAIQKIQNDKFHPLKTEQQMMEYLAERHDARLSK